MTEEGASLGARPSLGVLDVVAMTVGVVVGAGIFKLPSLVAANVASGSEALLLWLLGGVVSLVGALCYAELATTYPHTGGDYHYLRRAFGEGTAFMFAWARVAVIQTGSIALQAFLIGDYLSEVVRLGPQSSGIYAALIVAGITAINIAGVRQGRVAQALLTGATLLGLATVAVAGLALTPPAAEPVVADPAATATLPTSAWGMAMVFVLLTYGGWNEAAYLSAEMKDVRRNMVRALVWSIGVVTAIYLLANFAYLRGLGRAGVAGSEAVAADLLRATAAGEAGARIISLVISVAALSTINATVFTGARSLQALGGDHRPAFGALARWSAGGGTPWSALLVQGVATLLLVLFGSLTRDGFSTMVDYTAPVFWLFFLLSGVSLFVLRRREPDRERPFRVPLYPLTPLLFCAVCGYMLQSSLVYVSSLGFARVGAPVGVAVLLLGFPLLLLARRRARAAAGEPPLATVSPSAGG